MFVVLPPPPPPPEYGINELVDPALPLDAVAPSPPLPSPVPPGPPMKVISPLPPPFTIYDKKAKESFTRVNLENNVLYRDS